jgi:hypothetical protein
MTACFVIALCPVPPADTSTLGIIGASILAASFNLRPMSDADTSLLYVADTSLMTACFAVLFFLCPVPGADSSLDDIVGTSFSTALSANLLSTVCKTNSSHLGNVGASFSAAS